MKFGLDNATYEWISQEVALPAARRGGRVWVFGSRARGDHQPFSDLDLLLEFATKVDASIVRAWRDAATESRLPIRVELVLNEELAESYRAQVMQERVEFG